jgi:outer membrane protein insertion porin family
LRLSTFVDVGQVWQVGEPVKFGDLRASFGVALAWSSPVGPLKFSFAQPLRREPEDRLERFQFQLGSVF